MGHLSLCHASSIMRCTHVESWQSPPCLHKVISIEDDIPALVNDTEMALMRVHPALLSA